MKQVNVYVIADYYLSLPRKDFPMTNLKLNHLLFLSQAWSLAIKNKSVFEEDAEAWAWGSCYPEIFYKYRYKGYEELPVYSGKINKLISNHEGILNAVWEVYGNFSGRTLADIICNEYPWKNARLTGNKIINKNEMGKYYTGIAKKVN